MKNDMILKIIIIYELKERKGFLKELDDDDKLIYEEKI